MNTIFPSRRGHPPARAGFSVIELIISIALLAVIMTALLLSIRGSRTESEKSKEFFKAMHLAQKIIDDLDNRCRANLFTVRALAGQKLEFSVLEEEIPFFRFLEDTSGDGRTDNDKPIAELDPVSRDALEDYACKIEFDRKAGNGFARASVSVRWTENGRNHEYKLLHNVPDIPTEVSVDSGALHSPQLQDRHLQIYLFDRNAPLDELLEEFSVGRDLCRRFAEIMYLSRVMTETLVRNYDRISKIKTSIERDTVQSLYDIAWLHEANAITIIQGYTQLAVPVSELDDAGSGLAVGKLFKNLKAGEILQDLARVADTVYSRTNDESFSMRFNYETVAATNIYMRLLTEARFREQITYRQREGILQKVADLCTALSQNHRGGVMLTLGGRRIGVDTFVDETLANLGKFVEGKDYNRAEFIREKRKEADLRDYAVHEDVSEKFEMMAAVASTASDVLKRIMVIIQVSAKK